MVGYLKQGTVLEELRRGGEEIVRTVTAGRHH